MKCKFNSFIECDVFDNPLEDCWYTSYWECREFKKIRE